MKDLNDLLEALKSTEIPIHHDNTKSFPELPYVSYSEVNESYEKSDDRIDEVVLTVQIDLYSQQKTAAANHRLIRKALDEKEIPFSVRRWVSYDSDGRNGNTTVVRYIYTCEVVENVGFED